MISEKHRKKAKAGASGALAGQIDELVLAEIWYNNRNYYCQEKSIELTGI